MSVIALNLVPSGIKEDNCPLSVMCPPLP